jgi:hypothetical protein
MRAFVMAGAAVALGVALVRRQLRKSSRLDRLRLEHVSETARLYRNAGTPVFSSWVPDLAGFQLHSSLISSSDMQAIPVC